MHAQRKARGHLTVRRNCDTDDRGTSTVRQHLKTLACSCSHAKNHSAQYHTPLPVTSTNARTRTARDENAQTHNTPYDTHTPHTANGVSMPTTGDKAHGATAQLEKGRVYSGCSELKSHPCSNQLQPRIQHCHGTGAQSLVPMLERERTKKDKNAMHDPCIYAYGERHVETSP